MLPPIPQGLVPVTVQQDPVRPKENIQPVTPAQESEAHSGVKLDQERHPDQGRQQDSQEDQEAATDSEDFEEITATGKRALSRKGLLVNLRV